MKTLALLAAVFLAAGDAAAQAPAPTPGDFAIRNLRFAAGESLPEARIHYVTLGRPSKDAKGHVSNAVLILHGTGGSHKQFLTPNFAGELFGPGQLLDAATHYIVIPDCIGHGLSTKPSDGLHGKFPRYTYADAVDIQHRLLTEGLGVDHLLLVMGTSMGGMHAWLWGERFPAFMDGLVPLASLPAPIAGRNRMWRKMAIDAIRTDPEWAGGDYARQPRGLLEAIHLLMLVGPGPIQLQKTAPTRDVADRYVEEQAAQRFAATDANDLLYALEASRDYDPSADLEKIAAPLLAINFSDDFINPPELGILEKAVRRISKGRAIVVPAGEETRGHGTHSWPAVYRRDLAAFLDAIEHKP